MVLHDVYFVPGGRSSRRERVCITSDPRSMDAWAGDYLIEKTKERFSPGSSYARGSRIEIVSRETGTIVRRFRWKKGRLKID